MAIQTEPAPSVRGAGSIGSGLAVPTADRQDFDIDITWDLGGRLFYRDWGVVRMTGGVATVTVDAGDPSTYFTAFRNSSTGCPDASQGVEIDGLGRLDTGELVYFTAVACDNASGPDAFRMMVPEAANYNDGGSLSSGEITKQAGSAPSPAATRVSGLGAIGGGTPTLGSDRQEFDFDITSSGGRLSYTDYTVVRAGQAGNMFVDVAADPATGITSFHQTSATCVRFGGRGRIDTGELWRFYIDACDNGAPESDFDSFSISLPDRRGVGVPYAYSEPLSAGDIAVNGGVTPSVGNLTVSTSTTGSTLDPDGYTVTLDGGNGQAIGINGSVTYNDLPTGSHSVALTGVASNCTVSGGTSRIVTVTAGQTATTSFAVTCSAAATALSFKVEPSNARANQTIVPPIQIKAVDAQGNTITTFTGEVTISIGQNGGFLAPGRLSGTTSVHAVDGVAIFSSISIDQMGNGYTLVVTTPGLPSAESRSFNVGL
jgi:hypothetical protein